MMNLWKLLIRLMILDVDDENLIDDDDFLKIDDVDDEKSIEKWR